MTSPISRPADAPPQDQPAAEVFLDANVIMAQSGSDRIDEATIASDAREALQTLAETGHRLVLIADRPLDLPAEFPPLDQSSAIEPVRDAWFLTADPEQCGRRRPGLRSILVGPGPASRMAEIHRCDLRSRDLRSAVIEILSREAMTQAG